MGKSPLKSVAILMSAAFMMTSASLQAAELKVIAGGWFQSLCATPVERHVVSMTGLWVKRQDIIA